MTEAIAKHSWKQAGLIGGGVLLVLVTIGACASDPEAETVAVAGHQAAATEQVTTTGPVAGETVSQTNARQKAAEYLAYTSFSRDGLIGQLMFEGFTQEDASYGVDALHVDWDGQAAKKAAEYLDYTSFSRGGLIEQLEYEGFTGTQAEYGVGTTGL